MNKEFPFADVAQEAYNLWKRFLDHNRRPDGKIDGIEFLPQCCEAYPWRCLFCNRTKEEGHTDDCILLAAIELIEGE